MPVRSSYQTLALSELIWELFEFRLSSKFMSVHQTVSVSGYLTDTFTTLLYESRIGTSYFLLLSSYFLLLSCYIV